MYYRSVTAHGTLMALVFTTFFIMAFGYVVAERTLGRPLPHRGLAWTGFWVALAGTLAAVAAILSGKATVLYTFYPPLKAHPAFYIGATLLVVGSWIWGFVVIRSYLLWKREHVGQPAPLALHGTLATVIVWLIATVGVAAEMLFLLIPWSLGFTKTVDPELARMLFWYFGHPLVYFWLLPAYVVWYTVLPRVAGGKLFSDPLARLVFVLFIILSTPVGFHHQFMDPGIPAAWKLFHAILTFGILFPSFVTAFTVTASLEVAGRMHGATGLLDWLKRLPWGDPLVASVLLSMLLFAVGGIGGATYGGAAAAQAWRGLTGISAVGGLFLFASAGFFMLVMLGTGLAGRKREPEPIEWAEPLEPSSPKATLLDRYGLWTLVAVALVLIAYAYPLWSHLHMQRFGSPGYTPF